MREPGPRPGLAISVIRGGLACVGGFALLVAAGNPVVHGARGSVVIFGIDEFIVGATIITGGTDLLPNMKRRQQTPRTVVALRGIDDLRQLTNGAGMRLGAGLTLTQLVHDAAVREWHPGLWQAAAQVAHTRTLSWQTL